MRSKEKLLFFTLPSIAIITFVLLVIVGAIFYEGGSKLDSNSVGYSFSNNYLSDLGRLKTVSGLPNSIPFYSFNGALIILSAIFSFYFLYLPSLYDEDKISQDIARIGCICGFFASICFAGVAYTPADLFYSEHVFFANWLYRLMCLSIFFLAISFILMPNKHVGLSISFGFIGLVVGAHIIIADFGVAKLFSDPHTLRVLSQKAATIALIIGVPLMTFHNQQRIQSGPVFLSPLAIKK